MALAILPIDAGRYGTKEMIRVFGEQQKVDYQMAIEGEVALAQGRLGVIPGQAGDDIHRAAMSGAVTADRIKELEAKSDHDTAALVEALSENCPEEARPWIHYGLTSNDLVDTSNSMQMRDALAIIRPKVAGLARILAGKASEYEGVPAVGRTHGQHASIISFGLKFANWAEEMARHVQRIDQIKERVLICKTLGVVGTGSLMGADSLDVQEAVAERLRMRPATVATQIVARERYAEYVFEMALICSTLEKIATEIRNLQRTEIGELAEPFRKGQMGSSAVPVKRNPIKSERVSSLSRMVRSQVGVSFENIALWHERDLSNSANERFVMPMVSILTDEILETMTRTVSDLAVNTQRIAENLNITRGQIFAEFVLEALIKKGVPRFVAYRDVQRVAFEAIKSGAQYRDAVSVDRAFTSKLTGEEIDSIFQAEKRLGASSRIIDNVVRVVDAITGQPSSGADGSSSSSSSG